MTSRFWASRCGPYAISMTSRVLLTLPDAHKALQAILRAMHNAGLVRLVASGSGIRLLIAATAERNAEREQRKQSRA